MRLRVLAWLLLVGLSACGGTSGSTPQPPSSPPGDESVILPPPTSAALLAFEPFNYPDTSYPSGLSGQEGGFGFAHPWNDADGDVQDRVIGGDQLVVTSPLAPPSTGGRSIHFGTSSTAIFRDLDTEYGADDTEIWVSVRWISTDTAASEGLQVIDFNRADGGFGTVVGQIRGLANDDLLDGMYEVGHHPTRTSADLGPRDQAAHFLVLRFTFGVGDVDTVDAWIDPTDGGFDRVASDATVQATNAAFSRVTLRSAAADSIDELRIGTTKNAVIQPSQRMTVYRIGNSLTWDSQPNGIEALAGQRQYLHDEGYHIRCGQTLENIWAVPNDTCVAPVPEYGTFTGALSTKTWNAVTMQPFPGGTSTLLDDEETILNMIDLARQHAGNAKTRYYIYAAWPQRTNYAASWDRAVADDDAAPTVMAREYFEHLVTRVRDATGAAVYVIPVGEVLYELDGRLRAGQVPGLTGIADLYRDDTHLALDTGRFVAGLTVFSTLYAQDPSGIVKPEQYYGASDLPFTAELYAAVYGAVWTVVSTHPATGVAP